MESINLDFGGTNLIREAEARAQARVRLQQKQQPERSLDDKTQEHPASRLYEQEDLTPSAAEVPEPIKHTVETSSSGQKVLLENRMMRGRPISNTVRPPWFVDDEKPSYRRTKKTNEKSESSRIFHRTCNQVDFPSYSPKEMNVGVFSSKLQRYCALSLNG